MIHFRISLSAIGIKHRGLFSSGVCLQRENARPKTARHTLKRIQGLKLELLPHGTYAPDLAPSDLFMCDTSYSMRRRKSGWHSNQKLSVEENVP